jgi:hypothetical protein
MRHGEMLGEKGSAKGATDDHEFKNKFMVAV